MIYSTLNDSRDCTFANCVALLERHAGLMMRVGGFAGYAGEQLTHGKTLNDTERAQIIELGRTGLHTPGQIAARVGRSDTTVWRVLRKAGVPSLDTRRGGVTRMAKRRAS